MSKIEKLLEEQNTSFRLRETRVDTLNAKVVGKIINADSEKSALQILTSFRTQYEAIRLM
jgi:uncharacterized protein (DUF111 family)